jgi:peptidoglycan/LPS O-acetylase OafA/YrhL
VSDPRERAPAVDADAGGFESAARTGPRRFPALDGLRALAALLVVASHAGATTGFTNDSGVGAYLARSEVGVATFFLLSGFVLYRPFAVSHVGGAAVPPAIIFWRRRALRIFPAYWVALTFVPLVLGRRLVAGAGDVVAYYGLLQVYDPERVVGGLYQAWTLATEIGFYVALPVVAAAIARRGAGPAEQLRRELVAMAGLYAAAVVFRIGLLVLGDSDHAFTWFPAWLDVFALGMGLAALSAYAWTVGEVPAPLRRLGDHAGLCWAGAAAVFWFLATQVDVPRELVPIDPDARMTAQLLYGVIALLLTLPLVVCPTGGGPVRRALSSRPLTALGLVSYGIYLWHVAWIERTIDWTGPGRGAADFVLVTAVALVASVTTAAVSYLVVERPALATNRPAR